MPQVFKKIEPFVKGSKRTLLSASAANEVVRALNRLIGIQAGTGLKIQQSESNIIISINKDILSESGVGGWVYKGEWVSTADYSAGDVVTRTSPTNLEAGTVAGTFVCLVDAPAGTVAPHVGNTAEPSTSTAFWGLIDKNSGEYVRYEKGDSSHLGDCTTIDGGTTTAAVELRAGNQADPDQGVQMRYEDCIGSDSNPYMLTVREVDVCITNPDSSTTMMKMLVVGSEPY